MGSCVSVPSAPQCLRVLNKSTSQIKIIWEPPATSNGVLKGYQIVVRGNTAIDCHHYVVLNKSNYCTLKSHSLIFRLRMVLVIITCCAWPHSCKGYLSHVQQGFIAKSIFSFWSQIPTMKCWKKWIMLTLYAETLHGQNHGSGQGRIKTYLITAGKMKNDHKNWGRKQRMQ